MRLTNEEKKKRGRRKKDELKQIAEKAAMRLIKREGFSCVNLYSLSEEAGIALPVLSRMYGNINELILKFIKEKEIWINYIIDKNFKDFEAGDHQSFLTNLLKGIATTLDQDRVMQQLLIWEVQKRNEITKETAVIREANSVMYEQYYSSLLEGTSVSFSGFMAVMIAGIYYLILHKRISTFCGIDLKKEEGMDLLLETIENMCSLFFGQVMPDKKMLEVARKLKGEGVDINIISNCTGLSREQIQSLEQTGSKNV